MTHQDPNPTGTSYVKHLISRPAMGHGCQGVTGGRRPDVRARRLKVGMADMGRSMAIRSGGRWPFARPKLGTSWYVTILLVPMISRDQGGENHQLIFFVAVNCFIAMDLA